MPPTPGLLRAAARLCPRPGGGDGCLRVAGVGPGEGDVRRFEPSPRSQPVTSLFEPRSAGLSVTVFVSQGAREPWVHAPNRRHGCVRLRGARTPSGAAAAPPPRAPHRGGPFPHRARRAAPGALPPPLSIPGSHGGKTPRTAAWKGQTRVGGTSRSGHRGRRRAPARHTPSSGPRRRSGPRAQQAQPRAACPAPVGGRRAWSADVTRPPRHKCFQ